MDGPVRFCGRCGAQTQEGDKFCQSCGHELGGTVPAAPEPSSPETTPAPSAPPEKPRLGCGTRIWIGIVVVLVGFAACSQLIPSSGDNRGSTQPLWLGYYPWDLKDEYDAITGCRNMQTMFDHIDNASDGFRRRYGSNGHGLMRYFDERMEATGCYDPAAPTTTSGITVSTTTSPKPTTTSGITVSTTTSPKPTTTTTTSIAPPTVTLAMTMPELVELLDPQYRNAVEMWIVTENCEELAVVLDGLQEQTATWEETGKTRGEQIEMYDEVIGFIYSSVDAHKSPQGEECEERSDWIDRRQSWLDRQPGS